MYLIIIFMLHHRLKNWVIKNSPRVSTDFSMDISHSYHLVWEVLFKELKVIGDLIIESKFCSLIFSS